jgi:hypothetical protein
MADDERPWHRDPVANYDALGRKQPKTLGGAMETMRAFPSLALHFDKRVPADFFELDRDGGPVAVVVKCPCKADPPPRIPVNSLVHCEGKGCGRWFWFTGKEIRVARDPSEAETPTPVVH